MYACIGRVTRLGPIPPCLKIALFNAHVRPVMLYCMEALPLTSAHLKQFDQLQLQYIRWCLDRLHPSSPSIDTLAEAGELPISYHSVRARMNYYLLVKAQPQRHITTTALADAVTATHKQDNWVHTVRADMERWKVTETDTSGQLTKGTLKEIKQTIASKTKVARTTHWLQALKGDDP